MGLNSSGANMDNDKIAIVDMGSQYVDNFERILSEKGIENLFIPFTTKKKELRNIKPKGIIISGGPYSVRDRRAPRADDILDWAEFTNTPVLGVCYGHQLIAERYKKGIVLKAKNNGEYGFTKVEITIPNNLFHGISNDNFICWMSHGDRLNDLPPHLEETAKTMDYNFAAVKHKEKEIYGLQFHPEVTHTEYGDEMINNFSTIIAKISPYTWNEELFVEKKIKEIQDEVANKKIIAAVSGGVDSTIATVLAQKSVKKENILCIHVDTGMMRYNESNNVVKLLKEIGLNVKCINASNRFLKALKGVKDTDTRRKIIGEIFIRIFEEEAKKFKADYLLQATIAPDVIESTKGQAKKRNGAQHGGCIKLHHNVGGLPETMDLQLLEPVKNLFKYQIRILANYLDIPPILAKRQPQPGPSAAVRIIDEINNDNILMWQKINKYVEKSLEKLDNIPTQYFSILLPNQYTENNKIQNKIKHIVWNHIGKKCKALIKIFKDRTVGVKGDERAYGKTVGIGIYENGNLLWNDLDYLNLLNLQSKITGRIDEVVRVGLLNSNYYDLNKKYSILIRAVDTRDFMTAMPTEIPQDTLQKIDNYIINHFSEIGATYYDITTKPSSTIEYL